MRLFVAIELSDHVRESAGHAGEELRKRVDRLLTARWVPQANMHLTVRFIGHVDDERVPSVLAALAPALPVAPFDVGLGEPGAFPPHGPPRVLCIGLEEGMSSLLAMHEEVNRRVLPFGFEPETRPFSAHLTLARVKDARRGSGAAVRDALRAVRVNPTACHVSEAIVFESRLSPNGSTYSRRLRIPLRPNQ